MSTWIMYALIVFYVAILLAAAYERNWWRCLYFVGAIVISISVIGMNWRGERGGLFGDKTLASPGAAG